MRRTLAAAVIILGLATTPAQAQDRYVFGYTHTDDLAPITAVQLITDHGVFDTYLRGWFDDTGFHHRQNDNYVAGVLDNRWYRNFFLFDLSDAMTQFSSASVRILNPHVALPWCDPRPFCDGFSSPNPTETYFLRLLHPEYYGALGATTSGRTDIFAELGTSTLFSTRLVSNADNGQWIDLALNGSGLADLNARRGDIWGVGGNLDEFPNVDVVAPEPATVVLLGTGLVLVVLIGSRRRS